MAKHCRPDYDVRVVLPSAEEVGLPPCRHPCLHLTLPSPNDNYVSHALEPPPLQEKNPPLSFDYSNIGNIANLFRLHIKIENQCKANKGRSQPTCNTQNIKIPKQRVPSDFQLHINTLHIDNISRVQSERASPDIYLSLFDKNPH